MHAASFLECSCITKVTYNLMAYTYYIYAGNNHRTGTNRRAINTENYELQGSYNVT